MQLNHITIVLLLLHENINIFLKPTVMRLMGNNDNGRYIMLLQLGN